MDDKEVLGVEVVEEQREWVELSSHKGEDQRFTFETEQMQK